MAHLQRDGDQVLMALGALEDGGYGAVWVNGAELRYQRFAAGGDRLGPEGVLPVPMAYAIDETTGGRLGAAVLTNATVVVAYEGERRAFDPDQPNGIFMQRFAGDGQVLGSPTLAIANAACDPGVCGGDRSAHLEPAVLALGSGGFIVAARGGMSLNHVQRFDSNGNPSAPLFRMPAGTWAPGYRYQVDAHDGFTAYMDDRDRRGIVQAGVYVMHFDADNVQRLTVESQGGYGTASTGVDELLWLGTRYAFVTSDYGAGQYDQQPYLGTFLQSLDSTGQPLGERRLVPVRMGPASLVKALELAGSTHVLLVRDAAGRFQLQQYDAQGVAVGRPIALQTQEAALQAVALPDGGMVGAWTVAAAGARDVVLQRFDDGRASPSRQGRRMACLAGADAQSLTGTVRHAFVRSCIG